MTPTNIDRFLVVSNRSYVNGRKIKDVTPLSKKRFASPPSETPKKHLHRTNNDISEVFANCLVEGVDDDVGPKVAINSGASLVHVSLPASPGLDDLDGLVGQALVNLATTFDFDLLPNGSDSMGIPPFEFPSLLSSVLTPSGDKFVADISIILYGRC